MFVDISNKQDHHYSKWLVLVVSFTVCHSVAKAKRNDDDDDVNEERKEEEWKYLPVLLPWYLSSGLWLSTCWAENTLILPSGEYHSYAQYSHGKKPPQAQI